MRIPSILALAMVAGVLSACASPQPLKRFDYLLAPSLFGPPTERVSTDQVFAVNAAMRHYLEVDIADQLRNKGKQNGLIQALYSHSQLKLEYDSERTKTAAEAFETRSGNCLSLLIMTAALAHQLQLSVVYQSAYLDESWSRYGDLMFASGHVNVTLGPRLIDSGDGYHLSPLTVDFLPARDLSRMRTREIGEETVLAMYANNRAVEAMTQGHLNDAYAWAAEALRQDPSYVSGYNTLGVVYLRHGNPAEAVAAFERALALDPKDTPAMANLAQGYERQGRVADADAVRALLARVEPEPPFHFFNLGLAAMRRNDWLAARDYFSREVKRADYDDEFHFWLGLAEWRLGNITQATRQLQLAIDNSTRRDQHALYAAKLRWLESQQRPTTAGNG